MKLKTRKRLTKEVVIWEKMTIALDNGRMITMTVESVDGELRSNEGSTYKDRVKLWSLPFNEVEKIDKFIMSKLN